MTARPDVLCVADMCVDLVLRGNVRPRFRQIEQVIDDYCIELGGSANIFAGHFVELGGSAGVTGWVREDAFGDFLLQRLQCLDVDTSRTFRHPHLKTGLGVALAEPDDRAILTCIMAIDVVRSADLCDDLLGSLGTSTSLLISCSRRCERTGQCGSPAASKAA